MTVFELIDQLKSIAYSDNSIDSEVYIQIGDIQTPIIGIRYFPESSVNYEAIVLSSDENPKLIL